MLRHNVVNGVWNVGDVLPSETTLASDFDVSRTVIREAVSRLKAEGMLSSRQGRGPLSPATGPVRALRFQSVIWKASANSNRS